MSELQGALLLCQSTGDIALLGTVISQLQILDPSVALTHLAGNTKTVRLATGVTILSPRNPTILAKVLSSTDFVSSGRLVFSVGTGYIQKNLL